MHPLFRPCITGLLCLLPTLLFAAVQVNIQGVENERILKNIQARLSLLQLEDTSDIPQRHIRSLYIEGEKEIQEAVRPFGYYQSSVDSDITRQGKDWLVKYTVTLGQPLVIASSSRVIHGPGSQEKYFQTIDAETTLIPGTPFSQIDYDQYKRRLLYAADQYGYFDAAFTTQQIIIDRNENTARIDLVFQTGKPYYFGSTTFDSTFYDESFLRRFLIFKQGESYNEDKVAELQSNLLNSGFFDYAMVEADRQDIVGDEVPIDIHLTPRKRFTYTAGAGYGTDTGARASLGFQWRRLTRTGHSIRFNADPAQYIQSYSLGYRIPAQQPATDYYEFYGALIGEQPQGSNLDSSTKQLAAVWSKGKSLNDVHQVLSITYQEDNYRDQDGLTSSTLVLPRGTWEWIRARDRYNTYRGYRARLDIRGASEAIGSSTDFAQVEANGKAIYSFTENFRLITRGQFGVTVDAELEEIPPSLRFYAGGDNSVRGFAYQALGIKQVNNKGHRQVIGGSYLLVGSVEFEQTVWNDLSAAVFFDTGNAMNKWTTPLAQSVGAGLRYKTPIGPVRVDLATPISESTNQWRVHFNLGPDL